MHKFIYILFFFACSIQSNAQILARNMALRKPLGINTQVFSYTGAIQLFIVPNKVTAIQVNAIGAKVGTGARGQVGGAGANITTTLNVTPGQVLYIVVGGHPGQSSTAKYGFGGSGGTGTNYGGAGGGLGRGAADTDRGRARRPPALPRGFHRPLPGPARRWAGRRLERARW